ncbi:nitroreductase family protein [Sunxiuqinia sp. A32]|uniref:nitroreductase family protein n=1 Tax=Sunxiuqinia sp. A32 TaxID=3461496 RepID=UPI004046030F
MIEILRERRSCRKFQETKVEESKIEFLKEALLRSPSSKNINPWEFIFIDRPGIIEKLSGCKTHGAAFLKNAPLAVVIAANEELNDAWIEDCSIASILLQLTAQSLELGSCWIQVRNRNFNEEQTAEEFIQATLAMPKNLKVLSIIAIGYPLKPRVGKSFEELQPEKIHFNRFQ